MDKSKKRFIQTATQAKWILDLNEKMVIKDDCKLKIKYLDFIHESKRYFEATDYEYTDVSRAIGIMENKRQFLMVGLTLQKRIYELTKELHGLTKELEKHTISFDKIIP